MSRTPNRQLMKNSLIEEQTFDEETTYVFFVMIQKFVVANLCYQTSSRRKSENFIFLGYVTKSSATSPKIES
jgi:hypothetical protein